MRVGGDAVSDGWNSAVCDGEADSSESQLIDLSRMVEERQDELRRLEEQALLRVTEAESRAADLLRTAHVAGEKLKVEAQIQGRAEGLEVGNNEGLSLLEDRLQEANRLLKAAEIEAMARIRRSELVIVGLAIRIAQKVIAKELQTDEDYILTLAREALGEGDRVRRAEIRVSVNDYANVLQHRGKLESALLQPAECMVTVDSTLQQGDAVIHTEYGTLDGRVQTRVDQIAVALLEVAKQWELQDIHDGT